MAKSHRSGNASRRLKQDRIAQTRITNHKARASRSPSAQLAMLDSILGIDCGANRERNRLRADLAE